MNKRNRVIEMMSKALFQGVLGVAVAQLVAEQTSCLTDSALVATLAAKSTIFAIIDTSLFRAIAITIDTVTTDDSLHQLFLSISLEHLTQIRESMV